MTRARALGVFLYDFLVGDDWLVALGVVVLLGATALVAAEGMPAWWLPPLAVLGLLCLSLRRAARS
ncbi:MAG: hypothetical protein C5B48_01705 [Candidatus Rokuibacteriota bacterium]|nr:MAG: hypothetical protein C5B48_01705 [Candidatus Rokubacteria bacterium]